MTVSVAMCTYNGELYLKKQLDSILNQTHPVYEIIICDDGSTDNTIEIINDYCSKNQFIKLFQNETNLQSVKNFEKSMQLCTGDIIFLSDQDDMWIPEKVETIIDFFNQNPNQMAVATNGFCCDKKGDIHEKYAIWDALNFLDALQITYNLHDVISCVANIATGATMAFRAEIRSECVPIPIVEGFHHDEWIARLTSYKNQFSYINQKLIMYRIHSLQQVGGVFYDKTEKVKNDFIELFDINNDQLCFRNYKKKLKRLSYTIVLNKQLLLESDKKHQKMLEKNCDLIYDLYKSTKTQMKLKYPVQAFIISISDKILNKRQLYYTKANFKNIVQP